MESARPRTPSLAVFSPQRNARWGHEAGSEGAKGENSREVGSNREGLIPLDCVPCPATSAHSPPTPFSTFPFRFLRYPVATFPPFITIDDDRLRKCARVKGLFFFLGERSRVGAIWPTHPRTHALMRKKFFLDGCRPRREEEDPGEIVP